MTDSATETSGKFMDESPKTFCVSTSFPCFQLAKPEQGSCQVQYKNEPTFTVKKTLKTKNNPTTQPLSLAKMGARD